MLFYSSVTSVTIIFSVTFCIPYINFTIAFFVSRKFPISNTDAIPKNEGDN